MPKSNIQHTECMYLNRIILRSPRLLLIVGEMQHISENPDQYQWRVETAIERKRFRELHRELGPDKHAYKFVIIIILDITLD